MSEAVDTRIVEAKFDSSQFEKGVDRTVKKLDELKKSLTFEQTGKSIADLTSKAQEATEKASSSLEKLEDRITSFTGMLKQKLLGGIADEIVGAVFKVKNAIEGLVTSLSTAQISAGMGKYEQMLTSVRTMIAAGDTEASAYKAIETLGLYADQTSYSLDQMTSALSKMRAAGVDLDTGTKAVEGISNACAAAGVNAMDASRAFFNLSQAYSSGYLKYTDYRSLELLNMTTENFKIQMLEAAVAAGTLKKESEGVYKTINKNDKKVSAGKKVTTKNVTDALRYNFMNTEAMNKLFGEKYFFDEKAWKEIKKEYDDLGKSEAEALAEAKVRYGEIAVNAYFAAREAKSFTDVIGTLKDVISRGWSKSFELIFGKLEEAKDFFTWLTESEFANAIYSIGEFRNRVLEIWKNSGGRDDFIQALHNIDEALGSILGQFSFLNSESDDFDKNTTNLGASLVALSRDFKNFTQEIKDWLTEDPDKDGVTRATRIREAFANLGKVLRGVLAALKIGFNFVIRIFTILEPVFSKLYEQFENLFGIFAEFMNPAKEAGEPSAYKNLNNILGNVANVAEKVTPILETLVGVLGKVAAFFLETAIGTFNANLQLIGDFLGFIIELFGGTSEQKVTDGIGVIEGIQKDIEQLGEVCKEAITFVGDFFSSLFEDLRNLFGFGEKTEGAEEGGFFSNIINFFNTNEFVIKVKDWINTAIDDVNKFIKDIPNKIVSLGNTIWDAITGIFWNKNYSEEQYQNIKRFSIVDAEKYKEAMKTPFYKFVESVGKTIKDFFVSLPDKIVDFVGKAGDFIMKAVNAVFDFFLGESKTQTVSDENGKLIETTTRDKMNSGYENLKTVIVDFVKSIPGKIKSILSGLWKTVKGVAGKIWNFIDELLFGKKQLNYKWDSKNKKMVWVTDRIKTGFSKWLDDTIKSIKDFFTNPEKIKAIWDTIVDFFFGRKATNADLDKVNPKTGETYKLTDRVKEGFSEWLDNTITVVKDWILSIPEKISQIWNAIIDFIFGREATEADTKNINPVTGENYKPTERVKEGFSLWLHNVWTNIKTWFTSRQFLKDLEGIWNTVIDFIFGKEGTITVKDPDTGEETKMTGRVKEGFSKWLDDTVKTIGDWIRGIPEGIRNLWNTVLGAIFGGPESKGFDQSVYDQLLKDDPTGYGAHQYKEYFDNKKSGIIEAADEFLKGIGIDLGALIRNIPTYIAQGWDFSVDLFGSLLDHIDNWFKNKNESRKEYQKIIESDSKEIADDIVESAKEGAEKGTKEAENEEASSGFLAVIISIGQKIAGMITKTIPSILSGAWTWISDESGNLFNAILGIFNDSGFEWKDVETKATDIANKVANVVEGIPNTIRGAVEGIKKAFDPFTNVEKQITDYYKKLGGGQILESQRLEYERTLAYAKQQIESTPTKSGIFEAIKTIGGSIGTAIGDLGPDILNGLNEAFKVIGDKTTEFTKKLAEKPNDTPFFEWLKGLIGGEDGETSALAEAVSNIGETLKNLIIHVIPNFLGEAFAELAAGVPRFIKSIFGGENEQTEAIAEEASKSIGEEIGDNVAKSMLSGYKEALGNNAASVTSGGGLLDWFSSLFIGSASAEDSEGSFSEVSDQIDDAIKAQDETAKKATEMINRQEKIKEIEEKYNEAEAMRTDAMNLGKNDDVIRLTNNIIVYEAQLKKLRAAEGDLVEASILDDAGKIQEAREASIDFFTSFKEILGTIGSFANSNVIGTIAIVAGIVYALHAIKDMLSVTDEIEGIGYTAKWEAVKIAIIGIVAMLGWISYLSAAAANNPDDKRLDKTIETLTKIGDFFERLAGVLVTFAGLSLGKEVAESIGDIASIWATAKGGGWTSTLLKVLGGAAGIAAGPWIGEKAGDSIAKLFEGISDTFVSIGEGVDGMVSLISPAISGLAELDIKLDAAISAVGKTWDLIQAFYNLIGIVGISVSGTDEETKKFMEAASMLNSGQPDSAAFIADALERRMLFLTELTTMMNNLSNSLKTMSEIEDPKKQIEKMLEVVQSFEYVEFLENAVDALYDSVSHTFGANLADLEHVSIGFDMLADALSIFSVGISSLNVDNVKALNESLDVFGKIGAAFADVADNKTGLYEIVHRDKALSSFAKEIKLFGTYIKSCFTSISALPGTTGDEAELERTQRRIEMIIQIAQGMAKAASELGGYSAEKIAELGESLSSSGDKFGAFLTGLNTSLGGEIDVDRIHVLGEIAGSLGQMMAGVGTLAMGASGKSDKIPEYISQFMTGIIQSFTGEEDLYTAGLTAGTRLDAGVADGINTGLAISAVKTLADAIETAINEQEIKPKITPVLDIDNPEFVSSVNRMRQMLGFNPIEEINGVYNTSWNLADSINIPTPTDYSEALKAITDKLDTANSRIGTFGYDLRHVKFIIEGKEFAYTVGPDIDEYLGRESVYLTRR